MNEAHHRPGSTCRAPTRGCSSTWQPPMGIMIKWLHVVADPRQPCPCWPCCHRQGAPPHQRSVCAAAYKRMRQTMQRKPMQQMQQEQYREALMQEAKEAGGTQVAFDLTADTPSSRAAQEQQQQDAALNLQLQADINNATAWWQLEQMAQLYGNKMNYVTVSQLVLQLGLLVRAGAGPTQASTNPTQDNSATAKLQQATTPGRSTAAGPTATNNLQPLLAQLVQLVAACSSWFAAQQYAQVAFGMAAAGHTDPLFWAVLTASSERKLLSCSGHELALLLTGIAWSGTTPSPQWLNKSEVQLSKHWHATSVSDATAVLWAWGRFSHTPNKPMVGRIMSRIGHLMRTRQLGPQQLLQVQYFVARLSKHHTPMSWLHLWCSSFQPYLPQVAPAVVADVLLCLASLQYKPRPAFLTQLLQRLLPTSSAMAMLSSSPQLASQAALHVHSEQLPQIMANDSEALAVGQVAGRPGTGFRSLAEMLDPDDPHGAKDYQDFVAEELRQTAEPKLSRPRSSQQDGVEGAAQTGVISKGVNEEDEEESFLMDDEDEDESFLMDDDEVAWSQQNNIGSNVHEQTPQGQMQQSAELHMGGVGPEESFLMEDEDSFAMSSQHGSNRAANASKPAAQRSAAAALPVTSTDGSASYTSLPSCPVLVLAMQPVQGMVPDLVKCGPMSDPFFPAPYKTSSTGSRLPVAAAAMQDMSGSSPSAASPQQHTGTYSPQQFTQPSPQRPVQTAVTDAFVAAQLHHFSRELEGRHMGPVGWSIAAMRAPVTQAFVDAYTQRVQACQHSMNAAAVVDVLYGLSSTCTCAHPSTGAGTGTSVSDMPPSQLYPHNYPSTFPTQTSALQDSPSSAISKQGGATPLAGAQAEQLVASQELVLSLAQLVAVHAEELEPDALAQAVVSLARLKVQPGAEWLRVMLDACLPKLGAFSAWALPDLLVGLAALDAAVLIDDEWWNSFDMAALPLLSRCPPSHVSRIAWGLAAAGHRPSPAWLHELLVAALAQFKRMDDGDLVSLIWSCARLRHRPGTRWLDAYAQELSSRLGAGLFTGQKVADVMWGLAAVGHIPTRDWMQQLETLLLNRLAASATDPSLQLSPQQLAVVLWAFSVWHYAPSTPGLVSLLAQRGAMTQATAAT